MRGVCRAKAYRGAKHVETGFGIQKRRRKKATERTNLFKQTFGKDKAGDATSKWNRGGVGAVDLGRNIHSPEEREQAGP